MAHGGWSASVDAAPPTARALPASVAAARDRPRGSGWRELALGLAIFGVYLLVTRKVHVSHVTANAHGDLLLRIESALRLDVERPLNGWLARHHTLGALASWEYATTYIATTFGFVGWLWWRRREWYRWARGVLVATTLVAIGCFALWPLTPPRLLPHSGFADVVTAHRPFLSWGSGTVSAGADQWAAMPSLHIGWAAWLTVVSVRAGAGAWGRTLAAVHLVVTSYVVLATGNHYVLDIVGGLVVVAAGIAVYQLWLWSTGLVVGRPRGASSGPRAWPVPAADAFFLHVERPTIPQVVGGVAMLDTSALDAATPDPSEPSEPSFDIDRLRTLIATRLPDVPQLLRCLRPGRRFVRPRWTPADDVDMRYHVRATKLSGAGRRGLEDLVAELSSRPLDLHRPPWRMWAVRGVAPGEVAMIVLVHHTVGDGIAVVDILRRLLEPPLPARVPAAAPAPGRLAKALMTVVGVARLALDGGARRLPFAGEIGPSRVWRTVEAPLRDVRTLARLGRCDVTDVVLCALGEVVGELLGDRGDDRRREMRVAVPITLRRPGSGRAESSGNLTAALRIDVPLDDMPALERLAAVHASAVSKRAPSRVLATAAVVNRIGALPRPLHARLARAMYRSRFFSAIVTTMPGPSLPMSFSGLPLKDVYPVVPLADGVPLAAGTLAWNGRMCLSVTADPALLPEAADIDVRMERALNRLASELGWRGDADGEPNSEAPAAEFVWQPSSASSA